MTTSPRRRTRRAPGPRALPLAVLPALVVLSVPLAAQERDEAPADSLALVREARAAQEAFEAFREARIPVRTQRERRRCDEPIGRFCYSFEGADELDFPPEPPETEMARRELVADLVSVWNRVKDPWVLGQLVRYLTEDGRMGAADRLVRECGLAEPWWCHALRGYVLHLERRFPEAEEAFRQALAEMPEEERPHWTEPRFILSGDAREAFESADDEERRRLWERLWRFSNPLFLVEGNDRLTDHYARLVEVRMKREAAHPFGIPWDTDLEEGLIRYGRTIGWSRTRSRGTGMNLQDTRSVAAHHDPASRGYLFPEEFSASPADIPPETWITTPREARTWYAAPYAPDFRELETQVARFRRGDSLLVVGAYQPDAASALGGVPGADDPRRDPFGGRDDPFAPRGDPFGEEETSPVRAGLFLVPEDGGEAHRTLGEDREGVLTLRAPTGRYVSSLEVLDEPGGAAWRARQGVTQARLERGLAALSDVVILREGAPLPETLDEAIPLVRPGIRVARGEPFVLAWEVYGLEVEETARITIGFTSGRPGFLRRVGEFLGIVEPEVPVEITFDEPGPDRVETVFRAIEVSLPDLEPGEYTLHVRLELPGREPALASRPITVEAAPRP